MNSELVGYFGIGAGFLVICSGVLLAFKQGTTLVHLGVIIVGAALASASGFTLKAGGGGIEANVQKFAENTSRTADATQAVLTKLDERLSAVEGQQQTITVALKKLSDNQAQLSNATATPTPMTPVAPAITILENNQLSTRQKKLDLSQAFKDLRASTSELSSTSRSLRGGGAGPGG